MTAQKGGGKRRATANRNIGAPDVTPIVGPVPDPEPRAYHGVGLRPIFSGRVVECACWCGKGYVRVAIEEVDRGVTGACRRPGCAP